jgi:hypothetical protein
MSATVEIYVSYSGDAIGLAHRIARELGSLTYRYTLRQVDLTFDVRPWIDADGNALLIMTPTDRWRHGRDSGEGSEDGDAPYQYEIAIEFRGGDRETLRRLGRALFQHLSTLGLPLLYAMGESGVAYADFLPGRGTREFPDATPIDSAGRVWWYEPRLYRQPLAPWPGDVAPLADPPAADVLAIATGPELRLVAWQPGDGPHRWLAPAVRTTLDITARDAGLLVARALRFSAPPPEGVDMLRVLAAEAQLSTEDLAHHSTTVGVGAEGADLVVRAYGAGIPAAVPADTGLLRHVPATAAPQALGELVLDLLAKAATL